MFVLADDETLNDRTLGKFLAQHAAACSFRYKRLKDAYETDFEIFHQPAKPAWKPDERIAVNFAKYMTDTMNGFFIGNPIKITSSDEKVAKYVEFLDQYNDQDDSNAELSKLCCIYGKGYEMYYNDDEGHVGTTYLSPMEAFMVFDDSILKRTRYFVRVYKDTKGVLRGSVSDKEVVKYFAVKGKITWEGESKAHNFAGVPATRFKENAEEMSIFEPVFSMINAYNKAISEKGNDVDYFADAYLKIIGTLLDEDEVKSIRDDRIINFDGEADKLIVEFLNKPNGDETQEHYLDRLEKLIFTIGMVANISDENFGTSSGIALKFKLQSMSNLAKTKERKFTSGMNRRYKLIFSNPISKATAGVSADDWVKLKYQFTPNMPANVLEESEIATNLEGITSRQTQLKALSVVDNVDEEIKRIDAENNPEDVVLKRMSGGHEHDGQ